MFWKKIIRLIEVFYFLGLILVVIRECLRIVFEQYLLEKIIICSIKVVGTKRLYFYEMNNLFIQ